MLHLLLACSSPPPLTTTTTWADGACATSLVVEVQTSPHTPVTLPKLDQTAVADDHGVARFVLPVDANLGSARVLAGEPGNTSSAAVEEAPGALIHAFGAGVFTNQCAGEGYSKACLLNVGDGAVFGGDKLAVGGVAAAIPEGQQTPSMPLTVAHIAHWDLGAASADTACPPHLTVTDVEVGGSNHTYRGDAWVTIDVAREVVGRVLGAPNLQWDAPATGEVVLVVSRRGPDAPSRFERFIGEPGKLTDIRYLATLAARAQDLGSCGMYVDPKTKARTEMFNKRIDLEVALTERTTGREVASHRFQGRSTGCSDVAVTSSPYGSASFRAKAPIDAANTWVDAQIATLRASGAPR